MGFGGGNAYRSSKLQFRVVRDYLANATMGTNGTNACFWPCALDAMTSRAHSMPP